jgi:hypothetical protein
MVLLKQEKIAIPVLVALHPVAIPPRASLSTMPFVIRPAARVALALANLLPQLKCADLPKMPSVTSPKRARAHRQIVLRTKLLQMVNHAGLEDLLVLMVNALHSHVCITSFIRLSR